MASWPPRGCALITFLLIVGIAFAVVLADKLGRIRLQIGGFIGCALGLLLASFSINFEAARQIVLIFAGFMLFNFMTNIGPNAQTYLLAGEVFPTAVRGMGAGFAAAFAQDRCGDHRVPVPGPARADRNACSALLPGRHLDPRRHRHLAVPDRDDGVNLDEIGRQPAEKIGRQLAE